MMKDINIKNDLTNIIYVDDTDKIGLDEDKVCILNEDFKEKHKIMEDVMKFVHFSKDNNEYKDVHCYEHKNGKL
ncbi:hypothetical protein PFDG_05206 [Plasmodium falciparum Dd2]|uniref:Uncharacterized protein n=1 Tax=Plasmodium falciparum (isolate Dd2) TaxID=57267 RepID=A0A0L7MA06_PLAF4|nr:hypothetical protein PFDG_05206 [Plasmodium falciparum Dd2]